MLLNISRSKSNQAMKFGQSIDYNKINIFIQKSWKKWGRKTSFRPIGKSKRSKVILNFDFLEKSLEYVSPPYFVHDFLRKIFLMLCSINWPDFIVSFSLLLEILGNIYVAIVCFPGFYVVNFEINFIFLIKLFFCMTKKSGKMFKCLENEKSI